MHAQTCTFFPPKKGQSQKKWGSSVFDIKNSKVGWGEYASHVYWLCLDKQFSGIINIWYSKHKSSCHVSPGLSMRIVLGGVFMV